MEAKLLIFHETVTIETWVNSDGSSWDSFRPSSGWAGTRQVEDLCYIEYKRDTGHYEHEDDEDGLLSGSRHVALYSEGTWSTGADDSWVHDEPIKIILPHNECYLQKDSEKYGGHVGSQEVAFNLYVAFFIRVLGRFDNFAPRVGLHIFSQLVLFVDDMENMTKVDQCGWRDEDDLEDPESNVWDWEGVIIADVLTTRLFGITDHIGLFITPNL